MNTSLEPPRQQHAILQAAEIANHIANLEERLALVESFRCTLEAIALVEMPSDPGFTDPRIPTPNVGQIVARLQSKDAAKAAELLAVAERLVAGEVAFGMSSLYWAKFDPDLSSTTKMEIEMKPAVFKLRMMAERGICCYITGHRTPGEREELAAERAQTVEGWLRTRIPESVRIVVNPHMCEKSCWPESGDSQWIRRVDVALAWPAERIWIRGLQQAEESLRSAIGSYRAWRSDIEGGHSS